MDLRDGAGARRRTPYPALCLLGVAILAIPAIRTAAAQSCPASALTGAPACDAVPDPGSNPLPVTGDVGAHHVGNPIEAIGGNKYEVATDFRSIASPLAFVRHYNSALSDSDTGLGRGWRHGYEARMARVDASRIVVVQGDGRTVAFDRVPPTVGEPERYAGTFAEDGYVDIGPDGAGWHLPDGRVLRFRGGWLVAIEGADELTLHYEGGRLAAVRSASGLALLLEWQAGSRGLSAYGADPSLPLDEVPAGHLAAVVLPDGSRVEYAYSGAHTLTGVRGVGLEDELDDRSAATYRYDDPVDRSLLTKATRWREGATRTTGWSYDAEGRATVQTDEHGRTVLEIRRTPAAGTHEAGTVQVERRDGRSTTIRWRVDPKAAAARFDSRLVLDTTDVVRGPVETVSGPAIAASTRPHTFDPIVLRRLQPVPGTLDAELSTDGNTALRLRGTAHGRVLEASVAGRRVVPLEGAQARVCGTATTDTATTRIDRLAAGNPWCIEDVLWAAELAVEVEERAAAPARPAYQTRAGRNGPRRDPFCNMPGSKDCDALREDYELAELSACVYRTGYPCPAGWDAVDPRTFGMQASDLSSGSFHAEVFQHPSTGRNVLVFRGTDNGGDWWDNIVQGMGGTATVQFEQALAISDRLKAHHSQAGTLDTLSFAGHSLGGGLATAAALRAGREATVFNPSRLTNRAMEEQNLPASSANGSIDVVRVQGELVSVAQALTPAPGTHTMIARPPGVTDSEKIDAHGIDSVIVSIEHYLAKHCAP